MSTPRPTCVLERLAAFLLAHPHACDTAESMARWWFAPEDQVTLDELHDALDILVRCAVLQTTRAVDGHRRYRRIGSDAALIEALQRQRSSGGRDE